MRNSCCATKFAIANPLKVHQTTHSTTKHFPCFVEGCGKSFKTTQCLRQHNHRVLTAKLHKCDWNGCEKQFGLPVELAIHQRRHGDETFECDECDKRFFTSIALSEHQRQSHTEDKPFNCDFEGCKKGFVRKAELIRHSRRHTGVKLCACTKRRELIIFVTTSRTTPNSRCVHVRNM